jgi:hypothetical protein
MKIKYHFQLYALLNFKPKGKITFSLQNFTNKENKVIEQTFNAHYNHHGYKLAICFFCLGTFAYTILNSQFPNLNLSHLFGFISILLFSLIGKFISIHFSDQKLIKTVKQIIKIANHRTIENRIFYSNHTVSKILEQKEYVIPM